MIKNITRKDLLILFGNVIDHFDTSLYVFLAPLLAPLFFPNEDKVIGLIMAYSVFATTIITRPLGIYIFSIIAKNKGPNLSLSLSLIGVGITTFFVGFLPYHADIGILSPIIFILLRSFREIFAAGEVAIASIYILDNKTDKIAFKSAYLFQGSTMLGIILASLSATSLYYIESKDFWRIYYFIGGGAAIIGYILRKKYFISNSNARVKKCPKLYGLNILWANKVNILKIAIITGCSYLTYSLPFIIIHNLIPLVTNIDIKMIAINNNLMLIFDLLLIFIIGNISSNFHFQDIMKYASLALAIIIIPLFYFLENSSFEYVIFVKFVIITLGIIYMCPLTMWTKNIIPNNKDNYLIIGIGSGLGSSIIGKLSPAICLSIFHYSNNINFVAIFLMLIFLSACIIIINTPYNETNL
ncbi:MAG: MFS transporter [Rickettsiales bacterium]|nr:MAG: MFS transporter [Rickettsiales bacterium]